MEGWVLNRYNQSLCSPSQRILWLHEDVSPKHASYHITVQAYHTVRPRSHLLNLHGLLSCSSRACCYMQMLISRQAGRCVFLSNFEPVCKPKHRDQEWLVDGGARETKVGRTLLPPSRTLSLF